VARQPPPQALRCRNWQQWEAVVVGTRGQSRQRWLLLPPLPLQQLQQRRHSLCQPARTQPLAVALLLRRLPRLPQRRRAQL